MFLNTLVPGPPPFHEHNIPKDEDTECIICNKPFWNHDGTALLQRNWILPCGHAFHYDCIAAWISTGNNIENPCCPYCRAIIDNIPTDFTPVLRIENQNDLPSCTGYPYCVFISMAYAHEFFTFQDAFKVSPKRLYQRFIANAIQFEVVSPNHYNRRIHIQYNQDTGYSIQCFTQLHTLLVTVKPNYLTFEIKDLLADWLDDEIGDNALMDSDNYK